MTTHSTEEAMALLKATRQRLVERGREIARQCIRERGETHSREVFRRIQEEETIPPDVGYYWLGAVFHAGGFEWTGRYHHYHDRAQNIHERTIKVWRLAQEEETHA